MIFGASKPRLVLLADSKAYLLANCYQSQLLETLQARFQVKILSARRLRAGIGIRLKQDDLVLSVLKLRTLNTLLPSLQKVLENHPLFLYEQDPWENFMDSSPCKGTYQRVTAELNVVNFLNTSQWWSDWIRQHGMPSRFVRMGMLPSYCEVGKPWQDRPIGLGFQGSLHPHRKVFFDYLATQGCKVTFLTSVPYDQFLIRLWDMQIYIHTEDDPWTIDGKVYHRNALWIKDTEAAARGCFAIRDHEDESAAYGIDELPTIFTFKDKSEVPDLLETIRAMPLTEKNERMHDSANRMRQRDDWHTVIKAMLDGNGSTP